MGISQTMYIIKKYEDYNFEQLLMSNFIYNAWKEADKRGFGVDVEYELDEIVAMKNLMPIYEMSKIERYDFDNMFFETKNNAGLIICYAIAMFSDLELTLVELEAEFGDIGTP